MVLADTPRGGHRALVEYELETGWLIVLGWQWPDYPGRMYPAAPVLRFVCITKYHKRHMLQAFA